jgi:DNA-binding transcriptional ArsR family regulator
MPPPSRSPDAVDEELRALAHPARRQIVRLCVTAEHSAGELSRRVGLRQPTTSQHLQVLRDAGLLVVRAQGNQRFYRVDFERLARVRAVLDGFWGESLPALKRAAEAKAKALGRRP